MDRVFAAEPIFHGQDGCRRKNLSSSQLYTAAVTGRIFLYSEVSCRRDIFRNQAGLRLREAPLER